MHGHAAARNAWSMSTTAPHRPVAPEHATSNVVRAPRRDLGGSRGNEILTSVTAVVLVLLLVVQGVTLAALDGLIHVHLFVGIVLLGPVALKLGSTGYRFVRYYTGAPADRAAGPPPLLLRVVAPFFVAATLGLFGSGVFMLLDGDGGGTALAVHATSFWAWLACLAIHVVFNVREVWTSMRSEWLARRRARLPGAELRTALVLASLLGGVAVALSLLSKISGFDS